MAERVRVLDYLRLKVGVCCEDPSSTPPSDGNGPWEKLTEQEDEKFRSRGSAGSRIHRWIGYMCVSVIPD